MADKNTANIGFEKQIWDAACVLRGNLDASEYKSVVLGLIFLKYISDRFDEKYQALVEEGKVLRKILMNILPKESSSYQQEPGGMKLRQKRTRQKSAQ